MLNNDLKMIIVLSYLIWKQKEKIITIKNMVKKIGDNHFWRKRNLIHCMIFEVKKKQQKNNKNI